MEMFEDNNINEAAADTSKTATTTSTTTTIDNDITADTGDNISIANMLRQTANEFLRDKYLQGFEFNEEYNVYYNPVTGYYYDQNTALFYHPTTRCYYYYDNQTERYAYYSRIPYEHVWSDKLAERRAVTMFGETYTAGMSQSEVDVFECLNSLLRCVSRSVDDNDDNLDCETLEDEISTLIQEERMEYAPCVRLIEKTDGALYVITITGAKIGTTASCDIQLSVDGHSETTIDAQIIYSETERNYYMVINDESLPIFRNEQKITANESVVIEHGDEWQFGTNTCGTCEPGLLRSEQAVPEPEGQSSGVKISKEVMRRRNLRNMKKQYGIYDDEEERHKYKYHRKERNSLGKSVQNEDNSIYANCIAKPLPGMTVITSDTTSLSASKMLDESNRGFGMLQRMGWKQGSGLGKKEDGIIEPVINEIRSDRAGLGMKKELKFQMSKKQESKRRMLEIMAQRFQEAELFTADDENQSNET